MTRHELIERIARNDPPFRSPVAWPLLLYFLDWPTRHRRAAWPTQQHIAADLAVAHRTISRVTAELGSHHVLIATRAKARGQYEYVITPFTTWLKTPCTVKNCTHPGHACGRKDTNRGTWTRRKK